MRICRCGRRTASMSSSSPCRKVTASIGCAATAREILSRCWRAKNLLATWSVSPDGRRLAYIGGNGGTGADLWILPPDITDPEHPKAGKPEPFLRAANFPRFSPDGRWIAYRSNNEIYVRPFPAGSGDQWQMSSGGGLYALWAKQRPRV